MKQLLIFPPGWSMNVGNPHLALPLLKAVLEKVNIDVKIRDINWEIAEYYGVRINLIDAADAVKLGTVEAMDKLYFNAEDKLMEVAKKYDGEWNLQLGFKHNDLSFYSSKDVQKALKLDSPFAEYFKKEILSWIKREAPRLIGFSISSIYQIIPALQLTWMIRESGYTGFIIFGGNTISRLKEEIAKTPWLFNLVDGFIIFQGEFPLKFLVYAVLKEHDLSKVPNLIWRNNGVIIENPVIQYQDPNFISTPSFEELPIGKYWGLNYLPLLAARGCYYAKCSFCSIPYGYGKNGFGGIRNTRLVFEDMLALINKYNMKKFKFMDEAISPKTLNQLSELIINKGIQIEWEGFLRLEKCWLDKKFVDKLGRSGFKKAYFGLEIIPNHSRYNLKKNDYSKEIVTLLKNCNDAGIKIHFFCLFGFPGTGRKEAERTIEFILKYSQLIDTVDLNAYTYAKHTNILGIKKILKPDQDWALEYEFLPESEAILSSKEIEKLTIEMEDLIWAECPRLLHPIYRLISPWTYIQDVNKYKGQYDCSIVL